ncbi:MAG: ECF-type sigma factor [Thermoanaerobaculia bacterium]|nr:ECF-type sigma factor [Thermoanaerobaculia bacterium]
MSQSETVTGAVTQLLRAQAEGDPHALSELFEAVYDELHRLARSRRRRSSAPLDTTELVHEAYLKLASGPDGTLAHNRAHFLAVSALAMRHIVVDLARAEHREKRGGGVHHTDLDGEQLAATHHADKVLAVDQALTRLAEEAPRLAAVVECRYFGGLSESETADALNISERTVQRDWRTAKAKLKKSLGGT